MLKTASSLYGSKESALQALLSNRRSQSQAVLASLRSILEAILEDSKGRILGYLKTMDPPTYQYARYWDWIKPWVENEVATNTRNQHIPVYRAELELSINVLSLIEQVERTFAPFQEGGAPAEARKTGDLIQYPDSDGGPKPSIIWDLVAQETVDQQESPTEPVAVGVLMAQCNVSLSMPNGEGNFALMDAFQAHSGYQGHQGGTSLMSGNTLKRNFGRGTGGRRIAASTGQGQRHGRHQRGAARGNRGAGQTKLTYQPKKAQQQENDADSEEESADEGVGYQVQDFTVTQQEQAQQKSVRFEENGDMVEHAYPAQEGEATQVGQDVDIDVQDAPAEPERDQEMAASESEPAPGQRAGASNQRDLTSANDQDPSGMNEAMQDDDQEVDHQLDHDTQPELHSGDENGHGNQQDGNEQFAQQYLSRCLMSFKAQNSGSISKLIELTIKPRLDAEGQPAPLNFRCPESEILCEVYANSSKFVIHLTKLDPQVEEWGDFEWSFRVVEKRQAYASQAQSQGYADYSQGNYGNYGSTVAPGDNYYYTAGQDDYGTGAGEAVGAADEKACARCTYLNPSYNTTCEICGCGM